MKWLSLLKDYWWLATVVGGALILWGNIPDRVKKVEAGQAKQEEKVGELREWAAKTQGYIDGQQQMLQQQQRLNERLADQANAPQQPISHTFIETDERKHCWVCEAPDGQYETCWKMDLWQPCETMPKRK